MILINNKEVGDFTIDDSKVGDIVYISDGPAEGSYIIKKKTCVYARSYCEYCDINSLKNGGSCVLNRLTDFFNCYRPCFLKRVDKWY